MIRLSRAAVGVASAALVVSPLAFISPAQADTPGCVTRAEYRAVTKGMTKARVHKIFDTDGRRQAISTSGGYAFEIRSYKTCAPYSAVSVGFEKKPGGVLRMSNKSAVWVG